MKSQTTIKQRILRGIGANTFSQGVNVLIQLIGLPVFLAVWGIEKYGDWLVLNSLAAFLSMSDIGFAMVATNEMTMRVGRGDRRGALVVYQSMWALLATLCGFAFAVLLAILWGSPVTNWLPLKLTSGTSAAAILTVLGAYVLLGRQAAIIQAGFRCDGNYAIGRMLMTFGRLAEFIAQIMVALATGSMFAAAVASLTVRFASLALFMIALSRRSPWLRHGFVHASRQTIRRLIGPAFSFLGMSMGHVLSNQGMVQVVASFLGPTAVVILSLHRTLTNACFQAINAINTAVWPEYSTAIGDGDISLAKTIHRRACRSAIWLSLCTCLLLAIFGPIIVYNWTQASLEIDYPLFSLLLVLIMIKSIWHTSSIVPLATNQHHNLAATFVAGTVVSLLLATILVPRIGLIGVGIGLAFTDILLAYVAVKVSLRLVNDDLVGFVVALTRPPFFSLVKPTSPNTIRHSPPTQN